MNKKVLFTGGEENVTYDDMLRDSNALYEFIQSFLSDYEECIVSGADCVAPGAGNNLIVTDDGFVYLDGEILKVDAGTYIASGVNTEWHYVKATTYDPLGNKPYEDGSTHDTWQVNRAIPTSVASISAGELDCVNGSRWRKINDWHEFTAAEITGTYFTNAFTYPDARNLKWRIAPDGALELMGAVKQTGTTGVGFNYAIVTLPSEFTDRFNALFNISACHTVATLGVVAMFFDGAGKLKVGETLGSTGDIYFNTRIPLS